MVSRTIQHVLLGPGEYFGYPLRNRSIDHLGVQSTAGKIVPIDEP